MRQKINANNDSAYDLYSIVKRESEKVDLTQYDNNAINEMAIKAKVDGFGFQNFMIIMFKKHGIELRINETVNGGNVAYINGEDYFQIFSLILWTCILNYRPEIANFSNYFIRTFHYTFLEVKKSTWLKVTGSLKKGDRRERVIISHQGILESIGEINDYLAREMTTEVHRIFEEEFTSREKDIIFLLYPPSGKKKVTLDVAGEILGLNPWQVRYARDAAFDKIKLKYPTLLKDYLSFGGGRVVLEPEEEDDLDSVA